MGHNKDIIEKDEACLRFPDVDPRRHVVSVGQRTIVPTIEEVSEEARKLSRL